MARMQLTISLTLLLTAWSFSPTLAGLNLDLLEENKIIDEFPVVDNQPAIDNPEAPSYGPFPKLDPCYPSRCRLPYCRCSGSDVPGGLQVEDVPQMVVLTFQNAVNSINFDLYTELLSQRRNPNGCPSTATFFVSHNYSDYWQVQSLYAAGQEIGDNTVTSLSPYPTPSPSEWRKQLLSQKIILNRWGGVRWNDIRGERAPQLTPGGDAQLQAATNAQLLYDSSRTTVKYIDSPGILWPYTYDYASTQDCVTGRCPTISFPGRWEVPLVAWECDGARWATPLSCRLNTEQQTFDLLWNKFMKHYNSSNRAPLVISLDSAWFLEPFKHAATLRFLSALPYDTYLVSAWQAIQWTRNPFVLNNMRSFRPWQCRYPRPKVCQEVQANTCLYDAQRRLVTGGLTPVWRMRTCMKCPRCYPGLNDPLGQTC